jgi:peptide deformylase
MTVLKIVIAPNPLLQMVSASVDIINEEIKTLAKDMLDTMYKNNGVGLSAVQVGVLKRVIVADVEWAKLEDGIKGVQYVMINPEIIDSESINEYNEGCLSFPDEFVKISRPKVIRVRYKDINNNTQIIEADGLLATCIQHEIDHLNGKTISSYISHQKKTMMLNRLKKKWH